MAFVMYLGCALMDLVNYPWSTCLSAGAATPLNSGTESWRCCVKAFTQLITGILSLMVHLAMPGSLLCKYCADTLRFSTAA